MWPLIAFFRSLSNFLTTSRCSTYQLFRLEQFTTLHFVQCCLCFARSGVDNCSLDCIPVTVWVNNKVVTSKLLYDFGITPFPLPPQAPLTLSSLLLSSSPVTVTTLPDILFLNNSGVHNIAPQSVIWLYCTVNSATATPSITWTKDGVTLVNDPPHIRIRSTSNDVEMSTTSSLVVDNFGIADDDGSYVCQASDGTTTVSSSTLSLTGRSCWFQYQQRDLCQ